jgi:formate transporter
MRDSLLTDQSVLSPPRFADAGTPMLDYIKPQDMVRAMIDLGASKADLPVAQVFVRGMYGGALLAFATSISFTAAAQTGIPIVGALLFPVGFIIINLLGADLITGYFAIVPLALIHQRTTFAKLLSNFFWVFLGNLAGSLLYVGMMWSGLTIFGRQPDPSGLSAVTMKIGLIKSVHYEQFGAAGAWAAFLKAMLCNWMVTLGVVLPMTSRSVIGKVVATWVPIFMFFAMGWEHLVVNMFIIPAAMLYGAPISLSDWWIGNEIPVTIGNLAGGFLFTGAGLGWVYFTRRAIEEEPIQPTVRGAAV